MFRPAFPGPSVALRAALRESLAQMVPAPQSPLDPSSFQDFTGVFSIWDIVIVLNLSFALALAIAKVYQVTHKGISYSRAAPQTWVLMCVVIALIMLTIGSNIARAFSLFGALSIVRFRNAVKDSRDIAFVFWAMAIGMACGTRLYLIATLATVAIGVCALLLHYLDLLALSVRERILLIEVDPHTKPDEVFGELLRRTFHEHYLISTETVPETKTQRLAYSTTVSDPFDGEAFLAEIRRLNQDREATLIEGNRQLGL